MRFAVRTEQRCSLIEVRQFGKNAKKKRIWRDITVAVNARIRHVKRIVEVIHSNPEGFNCLEKTLPPNSTSIFSQLQQQQHARHLEIITHVIIAGLTTTSPSDVDFTPELRRTFMTPRVGATGVICTDSCPRILSVPRSEQLPKTEARGPLWTSRNR